MIDDSGMKISIEHNEANFTRENLRRTIPMEFGNSSGQPYQPTMLEQISERLKFQSSILAAQHAMRFASDRVSTVIGVVSM